MNYSTKFKALGTKRDQLNRVHNEGHAGVNPIDDEISDLANQWSEDQSKAKESILSGESLQAERAWFNSQKFTAKDRKRANEACLSRGYSLADLQSATKR